MRIIAGTARSLPLKSPSGLDTRPTTDRIKETLFNILSPTICDTNFLDLFSGSGAIGLEAVSRGAKSATFIEKNKEAIACIRENIAFTGFENQCRLIEGDVPTALNRMQGERGYDYIFLDPPYHQDLYRKVLTILSQASFVDCDTTIIVETAIENPLDYLEELGFCQVRYKKYKTNAHVFIQRMVGENK
ncbi:MAG: 16S rRNA (guanine(966)-N(2))-methyltransferase RsmD [Lachnospiraceae bacterium]